MAPREEYRDTIYCRTEARFSWLDRVRILFGSHARTRIKIHCENIVGGTTSEAETFVDRVFPRKEKEAVYALEEGGNHGKQTIL